jgi:HEAT repeat protein
MKRRSVWILVAVAAVTIAGVFLDPTQVVIGKLAGEAFFQGRPTRYWIRSLRGGPAREVEAQSALEQGHAESVPVLVGIVTGSRSAQDAPLRCTAAELLGKLGPDAASAGRAVAAGLDDPDPHVQAVCAGALSKLEVPAETAVPQLRRLLKTTNVVVAERELSRYRGAAAPAVPDLVALLKDNQQPTEVRWNAARTIAKIGAGAIDGLDALIGTLTDDDWLIREHSAEAIGELGDEAAAKGVPALQPLLSGSVAKVRRDAVRSLGHFGPTARDLVPEIEKLLDDEEEIVRTAAATALKTISPAP